MRHRLVPRRGGRRLLPLRPFGRSKRGPKEVQKALRRGFAGSRKLFCVSFDISFPFEEDPKSDLHTAAQAATRLSLMDWKSLAQLFI